MIEILLKYKIWIISVIFLLLLSQMYWWAFILSDTPKADNNNSYKRNSRLSEYEKEPVVDSYPMHDKWKILSDYLECPKDGYEGISDQLERYGFEKTHSPLENPNAQFRQRASIDANDVETFFQSIPMGSALVKIRSTHISIAEQRPDTLTNIVDEFIRDTLSPVADTLPDMDIIFNTWDEPVVLPHHPSLDYYGSSRPLSSESMDNPYVLALLASPQCSSASPDITSRRLNHYFFMRNRLKTHSNESIPVFSFTTIKNCFADVTYPGWHYRDQNPVSDAVFRSVPWDHKKNVLFWRGSKTGADSEDAELAALGLRSKFVHYAGETNRMIREAESKGQKTGLIPIDAGFTSYYFPHAPEEEEKFKRNHAQGKYTSFEEQLEYKYIMMLDGWSFNERMYRYLSSGSLLFRAGVFDEWYEHLIVPWKHYVPVKLDLSDLNEKLVWAKEHDNEAKQIVEEARKLALKYLNVKFHKCYLTRMLIEYASLFNATTLKP